MKETELQKRLARLTPGETAPLTGDEFREAFGAKGDLEKQKRYARRLGDAYECEVRFPGDERMFVLFVRTQPRRPA